MSPRNGNRRRNGRRGPKVVRALLSGALRHTLDTLKCSQASAARWLGVDEATVRRWLKGRSAIRVETVLRSRKLGLTFIRCLALTVRKLEREEREAA